MQTERRWEKKKYDNSYNKQDKAVITQTDVGINNVRCILWGVTQINEK